VIRRPFASHCWRMQMDLSATPKSPSSPKTVGGYSFDVEAQESSDAGGGSPSVSSGAAVVHCRQAGMLVPLKPNITPAARRAMLHAVVLLCLAHPSLPQAASLLVQARCASGAAGSSRRSFSARSRTKCGRGGGVRAAGSRCCTM